jgi:hypothetical protein
MKCANCHKPSENPVCINCWDYALINLGKFPSYYNELEDELIPSATINRNDKIQTSRDGSPIPARLETLHLRSGGISKPLMAHETVMRSTRKETRIVFRGEELNRIVETTTYIKKNADWAYNEYSAIDDLTKEIIEINRKIQYVLGHKSEEVTIGRCPTEDENGKKCNSALKIDPAQKSLDIRCRKCDTVWDSTKWRLLGRMLDEAH